MPTDEPDVVPLQTEAEPTVFDKVLRGYDPRQVNDYLDRVDAALADADTRHGEDDERLTAAQGELEGLRQREVEYGAAALEIGGGDRRGRG